MQFLNSFDAERMLTLKQLKKGDSESPNVQGFSIRHFFFLRPDNQLRSGVALRADKLVGHADCAFGR